MWRVELDSSLTGGPWRGLRDPHGQHLNKREEREERERDGMVGVKLSLTLSTVSPLLSPVWGSPDDYWVVNSNLRANCSSLDIYDLCGGTWTSGGTYTVTGLTDTNDLPCSGSIERIECWCGRARLC